jgi:hypothetical protein
MSPLEGRNRGVDFEKQQAPILSLKLSKARNIHPSGPLKGT